MYVAQRAASMDVGSVGVANPIGLAPPPGLEQYCLSLPSAMLADSSAVKSGPCTGQPAFEPSLGSFIMGLQPSPAKKPLRPVRSWDSVLSLVSTVAGDDAPSPSRQTTNSSSEDGSLSSSSTESTLEDSKGSRTPDQDGKLKLIPGYSGSKEAKDERSCTRFLAPEIKWSADARKLKSTDRQMISPGNFEISPGSFVKLMLKPKSIGDRKGEANFRKSEGVGSIEIKLVGSVESPPRVRFCVSVGEQDCRGPVEHDFGKSRVCSLPKELENWDFRSAVNPKTSTFLVSLQFTQIIPSDADQE